MALKGTNNTRRPAPAPAPQAPVTGDPQTSRSLRSDDVSTLVRQVIPATMVEGTFSTGSLGYRATGKATTPDGVRYQVQVIATRIGTKG